MKSLKKTLVLLVVLSMILSAVSPVFAFNDVVAEEYAEQANKMAAFGVFAGDANGNFNADAEITRAEMAVIIGKLMGLTETEANANKVYASAFSDVAAGEWFTGWINLAAGRGIISGFPDGTFRPNEKVTQAQAVTMIVKALGWGVVVDQTGTWPANYITKAAELRLFKDAVDTNSELVTRGNVAIYCYNALTAKTWDVVESTDGSLTSSSKGETILAKYFSDFVNEGNQMKLVEDAKVVLSGANTTEIGANQIKIYSYGIASFIDAEDAPRKNKETVTYDAEEAITYGTGASAETYYDCYVVAYVPAEVANIATLQGKTVDVIFGKNNEVAYIEVTDDSMDRVFVTAWDKADAEIELDGEAYEVKDSAKVYVLGYEVEVGGWDAIDVIDEILATAGRNFAIQKPTKVFNRSVVADVIFNEDEEIISINLIGSTNVDNAPVKEGYLDVQEAIVEKISNGKIVTIDSSVVNNVKTEKLDDDKVTVIKNNEVISAEEIEAGNVLTILSVGTTTSNQKVAKIYVSDATVEGTVEKVKNETLTIDGTAYNTSSSLVGDLNGELKDVTPVSDVTTYYEEDVVAYLNFVGEVVAVVAESEATNATLGMVVRAAALKTDDNDVDYLSLRILTKDGAKSTYKIYADDEDDTLTAGDYTVGKMVLFTADADKEITLFDNATENKKEGIYVVTADSAPVEVDGEELTVVKLGTFTTNYDRQTLTQGSTYRFNNSTVLFNAAAETRAHIEVEAGEEAECACGGKETATGTTPCSIATEEKYELAKGWSSICSASHNVFAANDYLLVDGTRVKYAVFSAETYESDTNNYAVVIDVEYKRNSDDKKVYFATLFVDGEEVEYELAGNVDETIIDNGDFVNYTVADEEITAMTVIASAYELADVKVDETATVKEFNGTAWVNFSAMKAQFEVKEVDEGYVYFADEVLNPASTSDSDKYLPALTEIVADEDGYIIYDLRVETNDGEIAMFDGTLEDLEGLYVVAYEAEADEDTDADIFVIFE